MKAVFSRPDRPSPRPRDLKSCLCPKAHHGRDAHYLAPPVAFFHLAAFLSPALHQRCSQLVLLCADGPLWTVAQGGSPRAESTPVAGGGGFDLRAGEKMLPEAQAGAGHARDAPWDRGRSQSREASDWVYLNG